MHSAKKLTMAPIDKGICRSGTLASWASTFKGASI